MEGLDSAGLGEPAARLARSAGMIQISAQMRVLVAIEPVDGRKGIDSLARLCQDKLAEDPFSEMRVRVSQPEWNRDPTAHLRWARILAGTETFVERPFRLVAGSEDRH